MVYAQIGKERKYFKTYTDARKACMKAYWKMGDATWEFPMYEKKDDDWPTGTLYASGVPIFPEWQWESFPRGWQAFHRVNDNGTLRKKDRSGTSKKVTKK